MLARNLITQDEKIFVASLPGVSLCKLEFDLYMDFFASTALAPGSKARRAAICCRVMQHQPQKMRHNLELLP
ncbi:hypothetical protein K3169_11070 [Pseudomonas phytophila]|uniref:Uncharacterized protein n=1 Tax=Pseudomonas phytophila TaxID=2867264 RepID=A0ABY6FK77_9PSED|nr:hypothetical protein [Pseudomonas phytophila]UXZ98355.1 hypothetical protein K3169_11070 [Pseudomonas phytophila]